MRIAYMIDHLRHHGTQVMLMNLAAGLAQRGFDQRVFCLNNAVETRVARRLESSQVDLTVIGKLELLRLVGLVRLLKELRLWRPTVVQTFLTVADTIGRPLARMADVPIVVSSIRARNVQKHWWHFALDRLTIRWVDRVIFNSHTVVPFAQAREGVRADQIICIPNGVHVDAGALSRDVAAAKRSEMGLEPSTRVIGTVGRLNPQKGHRFLLDAFANVVPVVPESVLWIIGDGPERCSLEALAKQLGLEGKVQFLGERADVLALLPCMDLYVHASLWEGMPNAVMEAMAAARPVVATRVDGTTELITDGQTGWLVEPCSARALVDRMLHVLGNEDEARQVGAAARELMAAQYGLERMVSAYEELYRGLAAAEGVPL